MDVSIALSSLPAGCIAPSESPVALSMVRAGSGLGFGDGVE